MAVNDSVTPAAWLAKQIETGDPPISVREGVGGAGRDRPKSRSAASWRTGARRGPP